MTIVVAGHVCVDFSPELSRIPSSTAAGALTLVGPMNVSLGGSVANTARVLQRLGVRCRVSARVGTDALGGIAARLLDAEGLPTHELEVDEALSTSYSIVIEAPARDRSFWHHPGANDAYTAEEVDLTAARAVHVGYPSLLRGMRAGNAERLVQLFVRARQAQVLTSLDLAVVDAGSEAAETDWGTFLGRILPLTDVVSPSLEDLRSIAPSVDRSWQVAHARELAGSLVELGATVALVSSGAGGLELATAPAARINLARRWGPGWADMRLHVEAQPVARVLTTNGAGDATSAGLLAAIVEGAGPADAARAAARAGAAAVAGRFSDFGPSRKEGR